MMTSDIVALIAAGTLSVLILSTVLLPFIAALYHVPYVINDQVVTGAIAALTGIISAVAMKKINDSK